MAERLKSIRAFTAGALLVGGLTIAACSETAIPQHECRAVKVNGEPLETTTFPLGQISVQYARSTSPQDPAYRITTTAADISKNGDEYTAQFTDVLPSKLSNRGWESELRKSDIALRFESPTIGVFGVTNGCISEREINNYGVLTTQVELPIVS